MHGVRQNWEDVTSKIRLQKDHDFHLGAGEGRQESKWATWEVNTVRDPCLWPTTRKKIWYTCMTEYHSTIKKNEIMPFAATWMDLETIILSQVNQRRRSTVWHPLYVESKKKKNDTNEHTKQKETQRLREQNYGCWGEEWGEEIVREFGMDLYTLLYLK